MLQQTPVASVLSYYDDWLRRFPDFATLARAPESEVLCAWQGLGYYARARRLHAAAKLVQERHGGILPADATAIQALPGIGRYTANAIATFAFEQSVPVVEANIVRVLARLFDQEVAIDSATGRKSIWRHAMDLLPSRHVSNHNSALMDLGALVCTVRAPKCQICPVQNFCRATNPESLPVKRPRPRTRQLVETHSFVVRQNRILLQQSIKRWRGLWILPPLKTRSSSRRPIHALVFPFTHHRVTLKIFKVAASKIAENGDRWVSLNSLDSIPIPSPHRRAILDLLNSALDVPPSLHSGTTSGRLPGWGLAKAR